MFILPFHTKWIVFSRHTVRDRPTISNILAFHLCTLTIVHLLYHLNAFLSLSTVSVNKAITHAQTPPRGGVIVVCVYVADDTFCISISIVCGGMRIIREEIGERWNGIVWVINRAITRLNFSMLQYRCLNGCLNWTLLNKIHSTSSIC